MSLCKKFLEKISRKVEDISLDGEVYLTRYVIASFGDRKILVHEIHKTDSDRNLHDHPRNFLSVILWGAYNEYTTPFKYTRRGIGSTRYYRADHAHKLELASPKVWTLVFRGPFVRPWGFITDNGWVGHKEYDHTGATIVRSSSDD